jgi:hypothetical protein
VVGRQAPSRVGYPHVFGRGRLRRRSARPLHDLGWAPGAEGTL